MTTKCIGYRQLNITAVFPPNLLLSFCRFQPVLDWRGILIRSKRVIIQKTLVFTIKQGIIYVTKDVFAFSVRKKKRTLEHKHISEI